MKIHFAVKGWNIIKMEIILYKGGKLEEICKEILTIANDLRPEEFQKKPICKKCAYHDFCFI